MNQRASSAAVDVEIEQSLQRTYRKAATIRPQNTNKAYTSKQAEFLRWCDTKGFIDATKHTVTGSKLHLFLEERVINRERRNKKGQSLKQKVGKATVKLYVAAVVDLWQQQHRLSINSHPNPRDSGVKELLKIIDYEEEDRKRSNFQDRGIGTMLDGYSTTAQMQAIGRYFLCTTKDHGVQLRNWLAFLLSHFALMRGESARKMELPDLHCVRLEKEGFSECHALIMVMRQGKTNQFGRLEVGACLRHKDVDICPHGALALYLFWRWHVENEPFPSFRCSSEWYPVKLLKTGNDPTKEMSYQVHCNAISSALSAIGLKSRAKTHIGRGSGARMAELEGASEAQIRRLGRWNNQAMENCYLTSLPREAMRTLAGFEPGRGNFYTKRATLQPPETLQKAIFPEVDDWLRRIDKAKCEENIAAVVFFKLLAYLRSVFLQDSMFMQQKFPHHPAWQHKMFSSDEYGQFKAELEIRHRNEEDPTEERLQQVLPTLAAKLDSSHHDLKSSIDSLKHDGDVTRSRIEDALTLWSDISTGKAQLKIWLERREPHASVETSQSHKNGGCELTLQGICLSTIELHHRCAALMSIFRIVDLIAYATLLRHFAPLH